MSVEAGSAGDAGRMTMILTWGLKIVLALSFGAPALMKLTAQPRLVEHFELIGLGPHFIDVTGAIELASVLLLLVLRTSFLGALGLVGISLGAYVAQIGPLQGDVIHV